MLFCTCLIVSNILAFKIISIGPFTATAALFIFPISYIINDLITEVWGYKKARFLIWSGFSMNFLSILFFQLAIYTPHAPFWEHNEAFGTVLGNTPRIAIASLSGFLAGSLINAYIMSKMKVATKGKYFSLRAVVSTLAGEFFDSALFFTINFTFILPFKDLFLIIIFQSLYKSSYQVLFLPITSNIVKFTHNKEGVEVYPIFP